MMYRLLLSLILLSIPVGIQAQSSNAGIVQGLWFDRETVLENEVTRVYVAIRNNTGADLSGRVEFRINDELIERVEVAALDNRIIETWADWTPAYGEQTITASLSRTQLNRVGTTTQAVEVISALAEEVVFVDRDTDGDGIGNETDSDDDNDGISDREEKTEGTDPLDPSDPAPKTENDEAPPEEKDEEEAETESIESETTNEPAGLEQYLEASPTETTLTGFTEAINNARERLDVYRNNRSQENVPAAQVSETTPEESESTTVAATSSDIFASSSTNTPLITFGTGLTNENGFGEIERTATEPEESWWNKLVGILSSLLTSIYTFLLFILSLYLSHPVFVQLSLLFLILFLLIKLAKRLGGRPQ